MYINSDYYYDKLQLYEKWRKTESIFEFLKYLIN